MAGGVVKDAILRKWWDERTADKPFRVILPVAYRPEAVDLAMGHGMTLVSAVFEEGWRTYALRSEEEVDRFLMAFYPAARRGRRPRGVLRDGTGGTDGSVQGS